MTNQVEPDKLIDKVKNDLQNSPANFHATLLQLKKYLEDIKNIQSGPSIKPQDNLVFKEKIIGVLVNNALGKSTSQTISHKDKILVLEILERDLISTKYNVILFNKLYSFLVQQDQVIAIQASKTIDALIKQINQGQQIGPGAIPLDIKQHYIRLFQFLKDKTEFLLKLSEHTKCEQFKVFKRQSYEERQKQKEKEKKQIIFKNSKSLKFINQVPHLFIHLMAYVDTSNRHTQDDAKIKELIRKSIENIIASLRKTPYEQFYNQFNYDFNNQLFGVMTKLLQFLFINLRSDKDQSSGNKSNQNLKKNIADQADFIKIPEVIKNFIYLLKNCSQDFQLNRYEIVNRLRLLLTNLDKTKLTKNDAIEIMNQILNEETIFGRKKILGDYSKNAICSYWIEIIKSAVLIHNIFPIQILSIRSVSQSSSSSLTQDSPQIQSCFMHIDKLVEQVMKTIFDNSIYPSVQEKCIDLIIYFIEQLFPQGIDQGQVLSYLSSSPVAKKIHQNKLKIVLKILNCTALKFNSIRQTFQQIDVYITKKLGHKATKKDLPEPQKLNHMQLHSLEISMQEENWKNKIVDYIDQYEQTIDSSLLTLSAVQNKFLTIYQEEDELCFNSHPVKSTNYTLYMKEVKTKLLEKCITLSHKITKTFLIQNIEAYSPLQLASLKSIYYLISAKKALTIDQCSILSNILKNGLKIFQLLHDYDLHSDDQTNKKGHLKNFMLIFAQIYDPVNFRDIFEPNMDQFFRNLITYAKNCSEYCLQYVLIEPYCSNSNQNIPFNKNIVELLTYNLILRLESTSDQLDPFHQFYGYKQEYFLLLQKLIRFPFRCLSRYADDSFIRNYFRQIILFLTKKAHTSRFCLDYLHLMRTLFKNILFNSNREAASPLFHEFYAICCKNSVSNQIPNSNNSTFVNVNVLDNFLKFFQTGIPQLADIVTELVIMLPLKSKHIIQFAKQGYIVKPLLHCLCLMSDYNYLLRTLKTFEIIISHSTAQQINLFLEGVKEKLINRLFEMIVNQYKSNDLKPDKINNDLSSLSLKLLAKLGALSRNRDLVVNMKPKIQNQPILDFEIIYKDVNAKKLTVTLIPCIQYALQIFHKLLDIYYQAVIYISMEMIQRCFYLLMDTLPIVLQKMHPLSQRILTVFSAVLGLSSKYLTISQSILNKLREEVKRIMGEYSEKIKQELKSYGLTEYCKFFIKCLVTNLNERVLITRQDNFIKEISQEPKKFLWSQITSFLDSVAGSQSQNSVYLYVITLLQSQAIMINNPNHIYLNPYQKDYNYVLPYKNAALSALCEIIDKIPETVMEESYHQILQSVFISVSSLPDILNLKISQHPQNIARKIFKFMLKDEEKYLSTFKSQKGQKVFSCILQNLVGYSLPAHKLAMMFFQMIMSETKINLNELFFGNISWDEICDSTCAQTKCQSKFNLSDFSNKQKEKQEMRKYPITQLIKSLLRITHSITQETVKNQKVLKMLTNTFATFEMLISIKNQGKKQSFQVFQILTKSKDSEQFTDDNVVFTQTFRKIICIAQQIISMNSNLYENYTKIIIQSPQNLGNVPPSQQNPNNSGNTGNTGNRVPPTGQQPPNRNREQPQQNPPQQPPTQSFNINTNTFIDDQEYGLNIEDLDMDIKIWGGLISSILKFLKTILINQTIFIVSKAMLKKKIQKSKLIQTRLQIIFSMFQLIGRVDRSVRQTSYSCLKQLLSRQDHPKDLIQNDDKLKHILRPVLISLQLDFKKFTPSFLHMFKKILKLLTQCFNITLIQKLVDKLREMERSKQQQVNNQAKTIVPQQPQSIKHLNYSQITNQTKCIANFLGLFQHLAYAYHNHRSQNYTVNSIIMIFKYVGSICKYFTPKLGKHTITIYIKKTLVRVFNTMCQKLSGQSIFIDGHQRQIDLQNLLQLLKLQDSFPLRQKLTRQVGYIQKAFTQYAKTKKKDYYTFLQIIYTFAKHSNKWMKNYTALAQKVQIQLQNGIQYKMKKFEDRRQNEREYSDKNQLVLLGKILLQYAKQNTQDINAIFTLVTLFKVRSTFDLHFLRRYLKYDLYDKISKQTKIQIMNRFLESLREPQNAKDAENLLFISQNIIYYIILIEVNLPMEERQILTNNQKMMLNISETIKVCLNPKNLYIKGNSHLSPKQVSYNYRIAIQMLQITNLMLGAYKQILPETIRSNMLMIVWGLLRIQDKIIKNYAFVWTSNYIKTFQGFDNTRALGLYLTLIRGLENLSQGDYEIGALIKKALNILIPYWDTKSNNNSWIEWSLKAVHDDANEPNRLVRFWQIVVKNHNIFHKFKQNKFQTQMVNSMQWLMVANNPTSTNPLVKKIASDMSFIYIQWKIKEAKIKLKQLGTLQKQMVYVEQSNNDRAAEICLNFFIKVSLNNSNDKDDKQIMKRSLYLLKKTLILWPNTKKKFESIKVIVNKLKSSQVNNGNSQNPQMPLRFHYTLLNIIHILLTYEPDQRLLPQLTSIFKLLQLGGQIAPAARFGPGNHPPQVNNTIFTMNNIYLLNLLCLIVKRLVKVAVQNEKQEESQKLLQQLHQYIRDGFEYHVFTGSRSRSSSSSQRPPVNPNKRIQIQVAISFLRILYDLDTKLIQTHLNYIKQVASSLKKMFEKGFQNSNRNSSQNRVFELPPLTESSFTDMLQKDLQIGIQLIKEDNMINIEENYQRQNMKSYSTRRPLFVVLIRILASKFNQISHQQDKSNTLDIFISIYQKIPDPELKIQVINILKCMFIGKDAFKDGLIPKRYEMINPIKYPTNKIFFLLFQDNNKFNQHFQRKKSKPTDQNYNINQRIYEEITTKIYFNFLCTFIIHLWKKGQIKNVFLQKIKIFVLYAVKVADNDQIQKIFDILGKSYEGLSLQLYACLAQDYKELNCAQQYLQGDQIMLFFTTFLYKKAIKNYSIQVSALGATQPLVFHNHYLNLMKSDQYSTHHVRIIKNSLKLSFDLLPFSRNLCKILKDYLMVGNYNQIWGRVLLQIALQQNCIGPQEMYSICTKINQWGLLIKHLQNKKSQASHMILDYVYRAYGDKDLLSGYRMSMTTTPQIQRALCKLQQRKYVQSLEIINTIEVQKLKRIRSYEEETSEELMASLQSILQDNYLSDISKECYKNLDRWDDILQDRNQTLDIQGKVDYLFHSKGNKDKINGILNKFDQTNSKFFSYYYGKSILNFLESNTSQNKELNISLLYGLLEWLSFPKNAVMNQNKMLVKIECLLQLQEGQKIKQDSLTSNSDHPQLVDALTRVVQSVYTQINSWRERMPQKNQDMSIWHAILGQRIMVYDFMKSKMLNLLESVLKSSNHTNFNMINASDKLLVPYTDIEWNKLKLSKQQRNYDIFISGSPNPTNLYLDQIFLKEKEKFYEAFHHQKDHKKCLQILDNSVKQILKDSNNSKDQELVKLQKIQLARLKAKIHIENNHFEQANQIYLESLKNVDQHLLTLWRDWMVMSIKAYQKTKKIEWAQNAVAIFPYALRYKYQKTRLLLAPIIGYLKDLSESEGQLISNTLTSVLEAIPYKYLILWLPQLIRLAESKLKIAQPVQKILTKLSILFPQIIFFVFKPFFKGAIQELKAIKQIYVSMKRNSYNLLIKLENFTQYIMELKSEDKINLTILGNLTRCFSEIQIPLYQTYKGQSQDSMIPCIMQINQTIQTSQFNGRKTKILIFLGSDGKQYEYRLQKNDRIQKTNTNPLYGQQYENMISSQIMEVIHNQFSQSKESSARKLKFLQAKKIFFQDDLVLWKTSRSHTTMLDILSNFLTTKTTFTSQYPESDKSFFKFPKHEVNKQINKRMKEIVPNNVMKNYFINKAFTYDQYISFRKVFGYQYGAICALNYVLGIEAHLQNYTIDMASGHIYLNSLKVNFQDKKISPFSVRMSRNVLQMLGKTQINGGVLPAFSAAIDSLSNSKLNFDKYIKMIQGQTTQKVQKNQKNFIYERVVDLTENLQKIRKILQVSESLSECNDVPYQLKYWF